MAVIQLYLAMWTRGSKPAHWSIFIPSTGNAAIGTLIHVIGNPATGFFLEFQRNYDFAETTTRYQTIPLAQVDAKYIRQWPGTGSLSKETTARDVLESYASSAAMPVRPANPFDPQAENCQNWIVNFIEVLITNGIMDVSARTVIASAPRVIGL